MATRQIASAGSSGSRECIALWGGSHVTILVPGEETGGAYSVLDYLAVPGAGSGLHLHHNEDESFYILEGALTFQLGEEKVKATPGMFVSIPREMKHAFVNAEDVPVRTLVILYPAGLEGFFREMGKLAEKYPEGPPSSGPIDALIKKYNLEFF